jgi:hypothetical protein
MAWEHTLAPSGEGTVVLDVGGDVGAAVIYVPAGLAGHEIEVRPHDGRWAGTHTAVRERRVRSGSRYAAVFGSMPAGRYDFRVRHGRAENAALEVDVAGAAVTEARWPGLDLVGAPAGHDRGDAPR